MAINNYVESWKDIYDKYKPVVNFTAGDYETLKTAIKYYITSQNPENYNDWAESSEVGMFANGLAYLGESLHYRVDLNAHDVFPSTTLRKQSLLNFTKLLSYSAKRNICSNGIAKLVSISTNQSITDMLGNSLKDVNIIWNDSTNEDWQEHFLTIMNEVFTPNNPFGKPLKKDVINGVTTHMYEMNNTSSQVAYSFSASVNGSSQNFEVVNVDIDSANNKLIERNPSPENAFHILYRNDGSGNASKNTGFFVFWKQGSLNYQYSNFTSKIENNKISIGSENVNEYDVWVQELDESTGYVKNNWVKIDGTEYLNYNSNDDDRNIYKVETRENDEIDIQFSDGNFGNIPYGAFRVWYRISNGNLNSYIKPSDIKQVSINIPYKLANTSDENTYTLTLTFSVQDITHIRQCVPSESLSDIRTRAPQLYATQNRMVTGQDYNSYPKSYGALVKKCKSILRTYAGNTRYIQFNESTGTYQDLNILSNDGYMYKDDSENKRMSISVDENLDTDYVIDYYILPLLNKTSTINYYYENTTPKSITNVWRWSELANEGSNKSYGQIINSVGEVVPFSELESVMKVGYMIKCVNTSNVAKWVSIINIQVSDLDDSEYIITINEKLEDDENLKIWKLKSYFTTFRQSFDSEIRNIIKLKIENHSSFEIAYDSDTMEWEVNEIGTTPSTGTSWLLKAIYNSSMYEFTVKTLNYIFGSYNASTFYFNTDNSINNEFTTNDYIKILKAYETGEDYYWKPYETIVYEDGYVDNKKIIVYGYNNDKDEIVDNPIAFKEMAKDNFETLYFINNEYEPSATEVDSMWGNIKNNIPSQGFTKKSNYYHGLIGKIYPAGYVLDKDVKITRPIVTSNGQYFYASSTAPHTFKAIESPFDYDIVDDSDATTKLVYWNAKTKKMTDYAENSYYTKQGKKNLQYIWQHYASSNHLIDPCPTNIIDMYVLTNTYDESVQNWIQSGKKSDFPVAPTTSELKSQFSGLENYNMISDTIVWHSIKYKLLFGAKSKEQFRANFKVVKSSTSVMSDNEIKKAVVDTIDEYFESMEAGEKLYFTKLSSYIHDALGDNISSIVIVSIYNENKFGNLFEIDCQEDEILLSCATIDDVQIINEMTQSTINIGN